MNDSIAEMSIANGLAVEHVEDVATVAPLLDAEIEFQTSAGLPLELIGDEFIGGYLTDAEVSGRITRLLQS